MYMRSLVSFFSSHGPVSFLVSRVGLRLWAGVVGERGGVLEGRYWKGGREGGGRGEGGGGRGEGRGERGEGRGESG